MEMYFLRSAACLAILLLFYKLMLERENMHVFKRFYLLTSIVAVLVIPLVTFTTYVEPVSQNLNFIQYSSAVTSEATAEKIELADVFFGIYLLGTLFFSIKFFRNLCTLILKIRKNPKVRTGQFINVLLSEKVQPHTFFSFIFFNKKKFLQDEIPQDVKLHEGAHARQKHSLDVLLVEGLQIFFWFNPLIFLLKDAVKLNHEFLADREVIKNGISTAGYQQTLLAYSSGDLQSDLVNPINYSSIKKRFTVMKTHTSKQAMWARGLLILPLLCGLLYSFSTKEVVERETNVMQVTSSNNGILQLQVDRDGQVFLQKGKVDLSSIRQHLDNRDYTTYHIETAENSSPAILKELIVLLAEKKLKGSVATCTTTEILQDKATPEMIAEYNGLVKDLNETGIIKQRDLDRVYEILRFMTAEQKKNAVQPKYELVPGGEEKAAAAQQKATPEMIAEYNKLAKHYNSLPTEKTFIKMADSKRMKYIYNLMTAEQKNKAEKYPVAAPPPPPADSYVAEYNELAKRFNSVSKGTDVAGNKDFQRMIYIYNVLSPEQKTNAEAFPTHLIPTPPAPPSPPHPGKEKNPPAPPAPKQDTVHPNPFLWIKNVPPPPPPPSPLASVEGWIEEGAVFFYNGEKITGKQAKEIVQKNQGKNLSVQVQEDASGKTVILRDKEE